MIGPAPNFINSDYFYINEDGWNLRNGAPEQVRKEFESFITKNQAYEGSVVSNLKK